MKGYDNMVIYLDNVLGGERVEVIRREDLNGAVIINGKIVLSKKEAERLVEFLLKPLEETRTLNERILDDDYLI